MGSEVLELPACCRKGDKGDRVSKARDEQRKVWNPLPAQMKAPPLSGGTERRREQPLKRDGTGAAEAPGCAAKPGDCWALLEISGSGLSCCRGDEGEAWSTKTSRRLSLVSWVAAELLAFPPAILP